jgi:hypothetical protein
MIYVKSALIGFGTVVLGLVIAPILLVYWVSRKTGSPYGGMSVGFSPLDAMHSGGFWMFLLLLFAVGFVPSIVFLSKK